MLESQLRNCILKMSKTDANRHPAMFYRGDGTPQSRIQAPFHFLDDAGLCYVNLTGSTMMCLFLRHQQGCF